MRLLVPLAALCALAAPCAEGAELRTRSYVVQITENCPEGEVACRVGIQLQSGYAGASWEAAGKAAAFDQMAFERDGVQREFNSWRHERPEVSQARWHLEDCMLTIGEPSTVMQTFKRLLLSALGGKAAGSYRRIEERR